MVSRSWVRLDDWGVEPRRVAEDLRHGLGGLIPSFSGFLKFTVLEVAVHVDRQTLLRVRGRLVGQRCRLIQSIRARITPTTRQNLRFPCDRLMFVFLFPHQVCVGQGREARCSRPCLECER